MPNILLIMPDQHRGDWLEYPENIMKQLGQPNLKIETPNIRAMMERGISFLNAYTPCPTCAPARACLASGKRYRDCRVIENTINFDLTMPTFYQILRDGGYNVGSVGKLDLNKPNKWWSNDKEWYNALIKLGFTHVIDSEGKGDGVSAYKFSDTPGPYLKALEEAGYAQMYVKDMFGRKHKDSATELPDKYYGDNWVAECGLEILDSFDRNKPWFLQVNFPGPHNPWDVTKSMKEEYKDRIYPEPVGDAKRPENMNGIMQNYAAMIHNIDKQIGLFIEKVKEREELDNTIIVYTSDHGEMMGDFGRFYKTRPEQGSVKIPMVIDASAVGGLKNVFSNAPVELEDLAATIIDYAGLKAYEKWDSKSMKPMISGETQHVREYAVSEYVYMFQRDTHLPLAGNWHMITNGKYKLTEFDNQATGLYDLEDDPRELNNLVGSMPEVVEKLHEAFIKEIPVKLPPMALADLEQK